MHKELDSYLDQLAKEKPGYSFPNFCSTHANKLDNKEYLAILQDPGNSSPENKTGECSILNPDPTAANLRKILNQEKISFDKVLFWNFFSFFGLADIDITDEDWDFWAEKIDDLLVVLPNVKVLIVFGDEAWRGMKYFRSERNISIISSPHPSSRGLNGATAYKRFESAWKVAKNKVNQSGLVQERETKNLKKILEVTGRDNQIIREALSIALPLMLRHSLAWSNTRDMMRILEAYGGRTQTDLLDGRELKQIIIRIIKELSDGERHDAQPNSSNLDDLVEKYLADITDRELGK